ncbi:MAG: polyphosphate kinase 1 [Vulcanococcus sp.]
MEEANQGAALFINRELSWIAFNQRVLNLAMDPETPLLEQAKFSAIFSNNLDEFFMVRIASLQSQIDEGITAESFDGLNPHEQLRSIRECLRPLLELQQQHYRLELKAKLNEQGIQILDYKQLSRKQKDWANSYFYRHVFPILTPLAVDPAHPFPFISNLSLNIAVLIKESGHSGSEGRFARIKVPQKNIPRFVQIPNDLHGGHWPRPIHICTPLEQLIAFNLRHLFPGMTIEGHYFFRVTRDADLELRELEADDLMEALEQGLRKRKLGGEVVRLEVSNEMPDSVLHQLRDGMDIAPEGVYRINGPLGLDDLMSLSGIEARTLKFPAFHGKTPKRLRSAQSNEQDGTQFESIFSVIRRGDVLLHHPYDLFSTSVEEFINQAADDAAVLAIKMTLYRVSKDSPIIAALIRAAENGKQVMALVELKARFDEDNNIQWARQLERSGVHVVYGVIGLKTHTKIALVIRREKGELNSYCHVGTGNYNSRTSTLYTDLGILSNDAELGKDLVELFNVLTGFSKQSSYRQLLVAPVNLRAQTLARIERETQHAKAGRSAAIKAKMNALVDPEIIQHLYVASQAGVEISLIVRGACSLRPGVKGLSERIQVRSIIGRFLEHSRLFWFANDGKPELFLGSADWMPRNLDRRVEAVVPIKDTKLAEQLTWLLELYRTDNVSAWQMDSTGRYERTGSATPRLEAQVALMESWSSL